MTDDLTLTPEARWRHSVQCQDYPSRAWDWLQAAKRIALASGRDTVSADDLLAAQRWEQREQEAVQ